MTGQARKERKGKDQAAFEFMPIWAPLAAAPKILFKGRTSSMEWVGTVRDAWDRRAKRGRAQVGATQNDQGPRRAKAGVSV